MTFSTRRLRLLAGLAAALVAAPAVAQNCVQPAERVAFEVRALQSQLMVAALSCNRDNDYNAFVRKFQRDLAGSYATIQGHYRRGGANGQRDMDSYITQLANAHSQDGIRQGSQFCPNITPLFQVALAQDNPTKLAELVVDRNVLNPVAIPVCADRPAAAPARPAARPAAR
jgi:hypothetical protein